MHIRDLENFTGAALVRVVMARAAKGDAEAAQALRTAASAALPSRKEKTRGRS